MQLTFRDGTAVGDGLKPYIVAEVNSSHGGSMDTARQMIAAAADCGCDCVKFQSWSSKTLYSRSYYKENPIAERFAKKFSLNEDQLAELAEYCRQQGVAFSSTPYSEAEADFLVRVGAPYIKIASMELNNTPFLRYIAQTGVPVVLSTGMGTMEEIENAVEVFESEGNRNICLLHCVSVYPVSPEMVNLNNIPMLKSRFPDYPIGFSDHSVGTELSAAAVALGACMIEKHLTLDKKRIGMDNQMALEPEELNRLVQECHNVYRAMGSYQRVVSEAEMEQRLKMRRSLVYTRDMSAGEILSGGDLIAKRPGTGVPPQDMQKYVGKTLRRSVFADVLLQEDDF